MQMNAIFNKKLYKSATYRRDIASPTGKTCHHNQIVKLVKNAPITDTQRKFFCAIVEHAGKSDIGNHRRNWVCWPAVQTLADKVGISRKHAHSLLNILEHRLKLLKRQARYKLDRATGRMKRQSNLYIIRLNKLKNLVYSQAVSDIGYTQKLHKQPLSGHQEKKPTATPQSPAGAGSKVDRSPVNPAPIPIVQNKSASGTGFALLNRLLNKRK